MKNPWRYTCMLCERQGDGDCPSCRSRLLARRPVRGIHYAGVGSPFWHWSSAYMKRPEEPKPSGNGKYKRPKSPDADMESRWPTLCDYMTCEQYEDGSEREKSSLTIKIQDGKVLAMVNDPSVTRSLYRVADSMPEAINAVEEALAKDRPDWRIWKESFGTKRRKK